MGSQQVTLAHSIDLAGFNLGATRLLAQQVPPDDVAWQISAPAVEQSAPLVEQVRGARTRAARAVVPQSFVRLAELVVLHRDPARFDMLYRALWRLVHEPDLRNDPGDADLVRLRQMAHAVRRDTQKMKARLAFRQLALRGTAVSVAWYEPTHLVTGAVAQWLSKRKVARWILLTPERSVQWDGSRLLSAPPLISTQRPAPSASDQVWGRVLLEQPWLALPDS
jgi:probable DNA metabolism protein